MGTEVSSEFYTIPSAKSSKFNNKFEVEKFDRTNRQCKVKHILIQELDTIFKDKLVWAISRKTFVLDWIASARFFYQKKKKKMKKKKGEGWWRLGCKVEGEAVSRAYFWAVLLRNLK